MTVFLKNCGFALSIILLMLFLAGCASFLEGDYEEISDHYETDTYEPEDGEADILTVNNYNALKNVILNMVRASEKTGTVRLQNYEGDPAEDISRAISEVRLETPLGAYAVEYFDHDKNQILSYYELSLTINYKRTKSQIDSIISTYSKTEVQEMLRDAVLNYETYLAFLSSSIIAEETFIREYLEEYYYENPLQMLLLPEITVSIYPDTGSQRIAELELEYGWTSDEMDQMLEEFNSAALAEVEHVTTDSTGGAVLMLCASLAGKVDGEYADRELTAEEKGLLGTACGALVYGVADSEGYAMAFKALCDIAEIECYVVKGQLADESHFWTIINVDGSYYHVDPAKCDTNGFEDAFLLADSDMLGREYKWNTENYVLCEGELTYADFAGYLENPE